VASHPQKKKKKGRREPESCHCPRVGRETERHLNLENFSSLGRRSGAVTSVVAGGN